MHRPDFNYEHGCADHDKRNKSKTSHKGNLT